MEQFLLIAAAHFLALLSPGPDFFLVARTSLASGWRMASGACVGIALANGVFIVAAFAGVSAMSPGSAPFIAIQLAGAVYLLYLGALFIRHAGARPLERPLPGTTSAPAIPRADWGRATAMGFLSGILNPKNALFYASLAAMFAGPDVGAGRKTVYGLWMFCAVFAWDLAVAVLIGNRVVLQRFACALPWLERGSGIVLIVLGLLVPTLIVWKH